MDAILLAVIAALAWIGVEAVWAFVRSHFGF